MQIFEVDLFLRWKQVVIVQTSDEKYESMSLVASWSRSYQLESGSMYFII